MTSPQPFSPPHTAAEGAEQFVATPFPAIAFLGAGSMAGAILRGVRQAGSAYGVGDIRATSHSEANAAAWRAEGVPAESTESNAEANRNAVRGAGLVILGVKPYQIADLARDIAPALEPDAVVVSLAAGTTLATIQDAMPGVAAVRTMPNTPAAVGEGVTGVSPGEVVSADQTALVVRLFELVGTVIELPEAQIDALSTISGSGPAYVYYFIEQLTAAAIELGFTPDQAARMVGPTFLGASTLLGLSSERPEVLRKRVTSPGGTTERAIAVFDHANLKDVFARATAAALARANELAES